MFIEETTLCTLLFSVVQESKNNCATISNDSSVLLSAAIVAMQRTGSSRVHSFAADCCKPTITSHEPLPHKVQTERNEELRLRAGLKYVCVCVSRHVMRMKVALKAMKN